MQHTEPPRKVSALNGKPYLTGQTSLTDQVHGDGSHSEITGAAKAGKTDLRFEKEQSRPQKEGQRFQYDLPISEKHH